LWSDVLANQPDALDEMSRAIEGTYRFGKDLLDRPHDQRIRGVYPAITCTGEKQSRVVPKGDTGLFERIRSSSQPASSSPADSRVLPKAHILVQDHNTLDEGKIGALVIEIDGTFAIKQKNHTDHDKRICAMTTGAVDRFRDTFASFLPILSPELGSLVKTQKSRDTDYEQAYRYTRETLRALASAAAEQWIESVLELSDIDDHRVLGSKSEYGANSIYREVIKGAPLIRLDIIADYSRITGITSSAQAERESSG
jgi:hypothetical protein